MFYKSSKKDRVVDAPLAESAIVGVSIGAAVMGMRPVAEMQFDEILHLKCSA